MASNENFEKEFQDAFRDAEVCPDGRVWTGIELELEKAGAARARRRVLFYQWLAAASMVFAAGTAAVYFSSVQHKSSPDKENHQGVASAEIQSFEELNPKSSEHTSGSAADKSSEQSTMNSDKPLYGGAKSLTKDVVQSKDIHENNPTYDQINTVQHRQNIFNAYELRKPGPLAHLKKIELPDNSPDPGAVLLARLADQERQMNNQDKKFSKERLWTSVGFGAGTFNPNVSAPPPAFSMTSVRAPSDPEPSSGPAYSVGAQVGYRLGKRLVVQGGFVYMNQQASYTSSTALMEATSATASLNEFADREENLIVTAPYQLSGSMQYMSVPMQAGILLLDRDFSWMINAGIATDFFIQTVLIPENTGYGRTVISSGDDSPYRPVYFAGLAGTELSYRFADKYRIALAPGVRYALQSIYKSDVPTAFMPVTYDVSLRFRYIFR